MRKLLKRKVADQKGICAICHEEFTDYNDIVPDHRDPKGMGGAWRDDHPDNIQATHWWCNGPFWLLLQVPEIVPTPRILLRKRDGSLSRAGVDFCLILLLLTSWDIQSNRDGSNAEYRAEERAIFRLKRCPAMLL
jgi:hypothetical protein